MLPDTYYVKRGDIMRETGVSTWTIQKWIRTGTITPVVLPGCKYGRFRRSEIVKALKLKEQKK